MKRNVILVGHAHCGKTSLAESLLFASGTTSRKGDVMKGNTVSDYNDDEIERQISINASFMNCEYQAHRIQLIDTPGYADFVGETVAALSIADAAIVVVDAVHGVEVGTEDVWERLEARKIPRIIFINKTDKSDANVPEAVKSIQEQLSKKAVVLDLASSAFVESVAETDDHLIEEYLESGSLPEQEVKDALRKAVIQGKIFPILKGSAASDEGIKEILELIIAYLPSPLERQPFAIKDSSSDEIKTLIPSEDGPFAAYVFKSMFDPHLGQLSLARVLRGHLASNASFTNVNKSSKESISSLAMLQGKEQRNISEAGVGDIIALTKLKNTTVCDTLADDKEKIKLNPTIFPEPSISASIRPKTRADEDKISSSLSRLCEEDQTFKVSRDTETKELIISGIGDLHLKVKLDRMKNRYHVDVDLGTPKVSYREAISKKGHARHKYKKQSGGRGQYGDVELEVEPLPRDGEPYEFVNKIFGGAIPRNYIPSVEKGVHKAVSEGTLAGYQLTNIRVTVVDGSYHEVDSSDMAFQIAGALAFKEAVKTANPVLLEPIMNVSIVIPDEFIGQITGDISSRRGKLMGSEAKGKNQVIKAQVPLSEMFKYATDLRSLTGGRGSYSMKYSHYEPTPAKITQQVVAQKQAEKEEAK
ncbi:MAG: elongation factor G [Candidatus Omnitrophota bacterium]